VKERLLEFLAYLKIGQTKFEEKVGLSRGLINNMKGEISLKSLKKITEAYPELNESWLRAGEGDMIKEKNVQKNEVENNQGIVGIQGNGHTINNNPNDISNLIKMVADKDYIIAQLRKKIEDKHDNMVAMLDEKERSCVELLAEKDRFIMEMVRERNDIAKLKLERENENLLRMDEMHKQLFELQNSLISLINKMNK
jgi:hypothetical protein